jgi:hypothetical protein
MSNKKSTWVEGQSKGQPIKIGKKAAKTSQKKGRCLVVTFCQTVCQTVLFMAVLLLASTAFAGNPIVLLNAVYATGAGTSHELGGDGFWEEYNYFTCQVDIAGEPSAVTVRLEGNLTGTTFSTMTEHAFTADELTATQAMFSVSHMPVNQIRGNLITLTPGGVPSISVTMTCMGVR